MKYYEINEATARQAKELNSFSDYKAGSATASYRAAVDDVYRLADEVAKARPEYAEKAQILADRYARKLADWVNKSNRIETMCPSIMITGGSNFPTAKKHKQNAARDSHYKALDEVTRIKEQLERLRYAQQIIKSGDADALEQLQAKLEKLEAKQAKMKEMNAYYRKHKTLKGYGSLTDERAAELDENIKSDRLYNVPFAPYALTNNNAKIKSAKARIAELERLKIAAEAHEESAAGKYATDLFKVVENAEIMRLQLIFDGKPDSDTRAVLKKNGFRWSPSNEAWQRQLTDNAKYAVKRIIEELS